jgi:uncharacterized protein
VLARLDTKQQAIIMGHAVPMPVVLKTRAYDSDFYAAVTGGLPIRPNGGGDAAPSSDLKRTMGTGGKERRIR